ncbi:hypothetical protein G7046_g3993 [Stylonectria norvegica]|nr:hypothetical protein G7046_g3993 [Stylonectria norvegica]
MTLVRLTSNPTLKGHKLVILGAGPRSPGSVDAIRKQFPDLIVKFYELQWGEPLPDDFPKDEWKDTTALLTSTYLPTKEEAPKLQYVQLTSAGANHLTKKPLFVGTRIPFCTANGVHGPQISEWVITTFLAFQHHIYAYLAQQQEGKWKRSTELTDDAVGKRVGILGYGSIGRQVARVATAMGMNIHAYTLHPRTTPESRKDDSYTPPGLGDPDGVFPIKWFSGGSAEEIHDFLSSDLDLLVVAVPLTEKTQNLISKAEFQALSSKKTFVSNIARGPIVNTDDLIDALESGLIRGAAIDVTDPEPLPDGHPLWSAKNLFITPHISGQSTAYTERVLKITQANLERLSEGKKFINQLNRKEGY